MRPLNGSTYSKPIEAAHWRPWNGDGLIACGQPGELLCERSPLKVTCRNCRRKLVACFTADRLSAPLAWLRGAWAGDAESKKKYKTWALEYESSVTA